MSWLGGEVGTSLDAQVFLPRDEYGPLIEESGNINRDGPARYRRSADGQAVTFGARGVLYGQRTGTA